MKKVVEVRKIVADLEILILCQTGLFVTKSIPPTPIL